MRQNKNESLSRSYDTAAVAGCDTVGSLLVVAMAFCPQPPPFSCLVLVVVHCSAQLPSTSSSKLHLLVVQY